MTPKERNARWRAANAAKNRASNAASRVRHAARELVRKVAWRAANPEKERARYVAWTANNPNKARAKYARRRARRRGQLCKCCTSADINSIYVRCPRGHEVDHRLPLALGGLHCCHNLQILTKKQHAKKTAEDLKDMRALDAALRSIRATTARS